MLQKWGGIEWKGWLSASVGYFEWESGRYFSPFPKSDILGKSVFAGNRLGLNPSLDQSRFRFFPNLEKKGNKA